MSRTQDNWETAGPDGTYIKTTALLGYDILINGTDKYLNFNTTVGVNGYGIRDNGGTMEFRNFGDSWTPFGSGGGSGTVTSVSVVTANGISGSVADPTTTPAITLTLGSITPSAVQISGLTASEIVGTDGSKNLVSLAVATYPSLTELTYLKGVTSAIQTQINTKANSSGSLTQFVGNSNWKVFYSDGSGDIVELSLGADGTFLKSNGAANAPTFSVPAGTGDVSKVGTPVNNQIGIWTGDGTIEGDAALTFDTTSDTMTIGASGGTATITGATTAASANGTTIAITGSNGGATLGNGGGIAFTGGNALANNDDGGYVSLQGGSPHGSGLTGGIYIFDGNGGGLQTDDDGFTIFAGGTRGAILDTSILTATEKTFTFPDASGTFALTTSTVAVATAVTVANEATDTTCFITFVTNSTGNLGIKSNANMTFNSNTGVATFASTVLTTTDINGGTIDGTSIGASSASTAVITTLSITSFGANWTNAGRTVADLGIVTTVDINGGTVDGVTIGGASAGAITGTNITANTNFLPDANDGAGLGISGTAFSDIFLASGAVINFNAGAATITHSQPAGSILTIGGSGATTLALGTNSLTMTGSLAATGSRVTKGWFTDVESTNMYTVGGTSLASTFAPIASPIFTGTVTLPTTSLTGVMTLAENTSIALDPAGSADGKYTGITVTGVAGATLAFGDLIYLAVADSRWELCDADSVTTAGAVLVGMCVLAAAGDGSATTILLQGIIRADAKFPALTIGAPVYASVTPGEIQVAQPSGTDDVIHVVGFAMTDSEIRFNPSADYITHT